MEKYNRHTHITDGFLSFDDKPYYREVMQTSRNCSNSHPCLARDLAWPCKRACSPIPPPKVAHKKIRAFWLAKLLRGPVRDAVTCKTYLGHSVNQSMVQQLTREGNMRQRVRKASPTGLIHNTTWRLLRTRLIKWLNTASLQNKTIIRIYSTMLKNVGRKTLRGCKGRAV